MIELLDLTVRYGEKRVLDGLRAALPESGLITVTGPSGAGKTTLLRVLCGLTKPCAGSVRGLAGQKISVVFQEDRLLPWYSALGNLALFAPERACLDMLEELGLSGAARLRPAELSGGMARRVAIARALLFGGDALLLDEPFSGLDDEAKARAADLLRRAAKLIVLVTHDEAEASLLTKGAPVTKLTAESTRLAFVHAPLG